MTATIENTLLPVDFVPPLLNPSPGGLVAAVSWTEEESGAPSRWLAEGVWFRGSVTGNFRGDGSTGVWGAPWCASPDALTAEERKDGTRPADLAPFDAVVCWGFDSCDMSAPSQQEIVVRAQQVLRIREPIMLAREFAGRLKLEAKTPAVAGDLVAAVGELESVLADANVVGYVHISPKLLPALANALLAQRTPTGWRTTGGHALVVDGGYRPVLGDDLLVATSAPYGWRNQVEVRTTVQPERNIFVALAERSSVIGFEALIGAVKVTP